MDDIDFIKENITLEEYMMLMTDMDLRYNFTPVLDIEEVANVYSGVGADADNESDNEGDDESG